MVKNARFTRFPAPQRGARTADFDDVMARRGFVVARPAGFTARHARLFAGRHG